LYVKSHLKAPE